MEYLGLIIVAIGLIMFVWVIAVRPSNTKKQDTGTLTEGKVVHLKEWMHEGHRRCQVEYAFNVPHPETGEPKTLRGKSNCIPKIFDTLELNMPLKVRYLPQNPEFSRPVFD